jgi:hypothetical protein
LRTLIVYLLERGWKTFPLKFNWWVYKLLLKENYDWIESADHSIRKPEQEAKRAEAVSVPQIKGLNGWSIFADSSHLFRASLRGVAYLS